MLMNGNQITFSCNLENLQKVRDFVRQQLQSHNLTDLTKNQIVLAIDEVCANLIIHSNNQDKSQDIELSLQFIKTPQGIEVELKENGLPFDYLQYSEPTIEELVEQKSNGNMGLMLVRRIMDEIQYIRRGNQNICRLYKSLA
jgi:serine/threonine-protein kinase RsbW